MKNLSNTFRIGIMALIIGVFSSNLLVANGTSGEDVKKEKSKDEIKVDLLVESIVLDQQLLELELDLEAEGVISCSEDMVVKILDQDDNIVYEGSYNGFQVNDKTLKKYMSRADLLLNVGNVAYYMLF